jgi:hypothetical protein
MILYNIWILYFKCVMNKFATAGFRNYVVTSTTAGKCYYYYYYYYYFSKKAGLTKLDPCRR